MAEKQTKSKFSYFGVVINAKKESPQIIEDLRAYEGLIHGLQSEVIFIASIIHDKDIYTPQDEKVNPLHKAGTPKTAHLHAFLWLPDTKTQLQVVKWLSEALKCKKEQISVEESNSDLLLVQYLTHQNHPEKTQYTSDQIATNNQERLSQLLGTAYVKPIPQEQIIQDAIFKSETFSDLITIIGIQQASKYRASFNQVKQEQYAGARTLEARFKRAVEMCDTLAKSLFKIINRYERYKAVMIDDIEEAKAILDVYDGLFIEDEDADNSTIEIDNS